VPAYVTAPDTAAPPGPVTINVAALIVAGLIASLKVAVSAWLVSTPVAVFAGTTAAIEGGGVIVVKVDALLAVIGVPPRFLTPSSHPMIVTV
jgi:ABC-type dipeptide/oligopeptide/nickel transport system permease component